MNINTQLKHLLVLGVLVLALAIVPTVAWARDGVEEPSVSEVEPENETEAENETQTDDSTTDRDGSLRDRLKSAREERKHDVIAAKKERCAKRVEGVTNALSQITANRERILGRFSLIATKVEGFVTKKNVTVPEYDTLVASIADKKAAAQTAIDTLKSSATFSCDVDNPKAQLTSFREKLKASREALKAYRDSIKKLVRAIVDTYSDKTDSTDAVKPTEKENE